LSTKGIRGIFPENRPGARPEGDVEGLTEETMPTMAARDWARRWAPEITLAVLAAVVFLGFLGALDLWGKREQRATAEALDTIDHRHWLIAEIQGRPRLEKPPLPRWTIAALIAATGERDEWVVRLPSALSALGMVALVYSLGCRLGGRQVGLASGLALTSMIYFVVELRQAGNDGPLAFFTTLALYAAWRRLHGGPDGTTDGDEALGPRGWNLALHAALGLGFLVKGPIVVVLVAVALVPYLATVGRLRRGLLAIADGWGLLLFVLLAASWPLPVWLGDPNAARVWYLEMGQKVGTAGVAQHHPRDILAAYWPWMTSPWIVLATTAVVLPLRSPARGGRSRPRSPAWFAWWWAIGNLAMFCCWPIAKPNYYLPCLPAVALLVGAEWVRLTRAARGAGSEAALARLVLQTHWVILFVAAVVAPVVVRQVVPAHTVWVAALAPVAALGAVASARAWHRGADAGALFPMVAAWAVAVLIGYGAIAPTYNPTRGHRRLVAALETLLPPEARTVMFFQELDEGLWFYLRDRALVPVPGSQPRYNKGFDLDDEFRTSHHDPGVRWKHEAARKALLSWIARPDRESPFVLIRCRDYDRLAPALDGLATPLLREEGLRRNGLVLLRIPPASRAPWAGVAN
jgi:4-amino-4-deoxy-L-arabinose transferase-like glycosyltransferase